VEKKKSHIGFNVLVVLLILIILASLGAGLYAWARYQTSIEGSATGEVAKWSFKADGNTTTEEIDFAITRTDNNTSVAEEKLAPGTYGEFNVEIDATGTETMVEYSIVVALTNKPTNLNFYYDEAKTKLISVNKEDKFCVRGFMDLDEVNTVRTEKIYWDWKYETGLTEKGIEVFDEIDTKDAGKEVEMDITVIGEQTMEQHTYLSDMVQVGDYVNYNAASGNGANKSYTPTSDLTGTTEGINTFNSSDIFNSEAPAQWRVLSIDNVAGTVELMSADPTAQQVTLSGGDGFVNAKTVLNNLGAIYGNGDGAIGGRSITREDVEYYLNYNPYTYIFSEADSGGIKGGVNYGDTRDYTSGDFFKEIYDEEGNVIDYEKTTTVAPVTMTHTYYVCDKPLDCLSNITIYNMIFKKSTDININKSDYWLASYCTHIRFDNCGFAVNRLRAGYIGGLCIYNSKGGQMALAHRVVPVVTLKEKIQTTGQDANGVWQLKIN